MEFGLDKRTTHKWTDHIGKIRASDGIFLDTPKIRDVVLTEKYQHVVILQDIRNKQIEGEG